MTGEAIRLVQAITSRHPVPEALVDEVDPYDMADLILTLMRWPAVPGAEEWLTVDPVTAAQLPGVYGGPPVDASPAEFVHAVADSRHLDADYLAARVDVLALGVLAVAVMSWPAITGNPGQWLDRWQIARLAA